jgi:hypothetical protein
MSIFLEFMLFLQRKISDLRASTGIFLLINYDVSVKNYINSIYTEFYTSSLNSSVKNLV